MIYTANKNYRCVACKKMILKGDKYWKSDLKNHKEHLNCDDKAENKEGENNGKV